MAVSPLAVTLPVGFVTMFAVPAAVTGGAFTIPAGASYGVNVTFAPTATTIAASPSP